MKVTIELNESELVVCVREYLARGGHVNGQKTVTVSFKGGEGRLTAVADITESTDTRMSTYLDR